MDSRGLDGWSLIVGAGTRGLRGRWKPRTQTDAEIQDAGNSAEHVDSKWIGRSWIIGDLRGAGAWKLCGRSGLGWMKSGDTCRRLQRYMGPGIMVGCLKEAGTRCNLADEADAKDWEVARTRDEGSHAGTLGRSRRGGCFAILPRGRMDCTRLRCLGSHRRLKLR